MMSTTQKIIFVSPFQLPWWSCVCLFVAILVQNSIRPSYVFLGSISSRIHFRLGAEAHSGTTTLHGGLPSRFLGEPFFFLDDGGIAVMCCF